MFLEANDVMLLGTIPPQNSLYKAKQSFLALDYE